MTKDTKFTDIALKQKRLSYLFSTILSILNILIMLQTTLAIWGIKIYITAPKITREFLLRYEIYIRYMELSMMMLLVVDSYVHQYYRRKYGTNPPRIYGIIVSFYVFFVSLLAYYVYQIWVFIYFAIWSALALTYYIAIENPYLEELKRSKFIRKTE